MSTPTEATEVTLSVVHTAETALSLLKQGDSVILVTRNFKRLRKLGHFGSALTIPDPVTITESSCEDPEDLGTVSVPEALYLVLHHNAKVLHDNELESNVIDASTAIKRLLSCGLESGHVGGASKQRAKCLAYAFFRNNNWVPRDGYQYGADFVLYDARGPDRVHAEYAVLVLQDCDKLSHNTFLAHARCTTQAKKALVICTVSSAKSLDAISASEFADLYISFAAGASQNRFSVNGCNVVSQTLRITCIALQRWQPKLNREEKK